MTDYYSPYDLLRRRFEPLEAKFNPSGIGPGMSYGQLLSILADYAPGIGDIKSGMDAIGAVQQGDLLGAGLTGIGVLPMIGSIKGYRGTLHPEIRNYPKDVTSVYSGDVGGGILGPSFSDSLDVAKSYPYSRKPDVVPTMLEADLEINNPKKFTSLNALQKAIWNHFGEEEVIKRLYSKPSGRVEAVKQLAEEYKTYLKEQGYDGIAFKEGPSHSPTKNKQTTYMPFANEQIKVTKQTPYDQLKELLGGN